MMSTPFGWSTQIAVLAAVRRGARPQVRTLVTKYALGLLLAAALAFATGATPVELQAHRSVSFEPAVNGRPDAQRTMLLTGESSTAPWVALTSRRVSPGAPTSAYGMDVPLAYYNLSFALSRRTGGITPPVQARIFAYMGLALYESVVGGMPHHRSIAGSLRGAGSAGAESVPIVTRCMVARTPGSRNRDSCPNAKSAPVRVG